MKQGFLSGGSSSRVLAIAVLCSMLFAGSLSGEEHANLLYINGPQWPGSRLRISATAADTRVGISDCALGLDMRDLAFRGSLIQEDFRPPYLCGEGSVLGDGTVVGVARLPVLSGQASFATELIFRDGRGILNVVDVPSLPEPLTAAQRDGDSLFSATYLFPAIEVTPQRSTYLALVADSPSGSIDVSISVRNGANEEIAVEYVNGTGFVFYAIQTPLSVGSLEVTAEVQLVFPRLEPAPTYAVAFVGLREGGSPRVIVPELSIAVSQP